MNRNESATSDSRFWLLTAQQLFREAALDAWVGVLSSKQANVWYHPEHQVYLKIFLEPKLVKRLRAKLLPFYARQRRFITKTQQLIDIDFPAPQIMAGGELDVGGFVVTKAFPGIGLGSFFSQYLRKSATDKRLRRWKREVMDALGKLVGRLHNSGVVHGDLRPNNILLSAQNREPTFCFIDNERNHYGYGRAAVSAAIKNLSQLNMIWPEDVSASYRLRFINSYWETNPYGIGKKQFIRRINAITSRRLQGKRRGGYLDAGQIKIIQPDMRTLLGGD